MSTQTLSTVPTKSAARSEVVTGVAPAPLPKYLEDDDDDDYDDCEARSDDEDDDAGSLVDFVVDDEEDDDEEDDDEEDDDEDEGEDVATEIKPRDLDGIDAQNIICGKRRRVTTTRYEDTVFASDEYRKLVLCDVPVDELSAIDASDDGEGVSDDEDEEYVPKSDDDEDESDDTANDDASPPPPSPSPSPAASKHGKK